MRLLVDGVQRTMNVSEFHNDGLSARDMNLVWL